MIGVLVTFIRVVYGRMIYMSVPIYTLAIFPMLRFANTSFKRVTSFEL